MDDDANDDDDAFVRLDLSATQGGGGKAALHAVSSKNPKIQTSQN